MKYLLTLSLIPLIGIASAFMILESGEYYSTFYSNNIYKGYWSALLVEMFLTVFAVIYFKKRPLLNLSIKIIMVFLFMVMISGASLKIISPLLDQLASVNNNDRLVSFLLDENKQSKTNLNLLKGQRTNTALQAKHQREMTKELVKGLKKESKSSWMIWIAILFSTFLRFSVQLANLIMAHILGVLWRDLFRTKRKYTKKSKSFSKKLLKIG